MTTIWGVVNANGTIASGSGGEGDYDFAVINEGPGVYQISFNGNFAGLPAITGSQVLWGTLSESPLDNVVFPYLTAASATAITGASNGSQQNRSFSFIAVGESSTGR
ncbi:Uncharacterised protein [Pannonibacter phragmitetus]|uniref:Uncharacterized protein n=1 Tax=Pannonibacter phragmitetus TaxID=121719 RepID=A0A378ZXB5_9HYPH|nr:hypothetical protein [Pannonibacter phragmitetus]SUB01875.1 Uncharacterised protein [Pannonibacter phragmitetus]